MRVTSNDSSVEIGGKIAGRRQASMVLPEPGGPLKSNLWPLLLCVCLAGRSPASGLCRWLFRVFSAARTLTLWRRSGRSWPSGREGVRVGEVDLEVAEAAAFW